MVGIADEGGLLEMIGEVLKVNILQPKNNFRREHCVSSALLDSKLQNLSTAVECFLMRHQQNLATAI